MRGEGREIGCGKLRRGVAWEASVESQPRSHPPTEEQNALHKTEKRYTLYGTLPAVSMSRRSRERLSGPPLRCAVSRQVMRSAMAPRVEHHVCNGPFCDGSYQGSLVHVCTLVFVCPCVDIIHRLYRFRSVSTCSSLLRFERQAVPHRTTGNHTGGLAHIA